MDKPCPWRSEPKKTCDYCKHMSKNPLGKYYPCGKNVPNEERLTHLYDVDCDQWEPSSYWKPSCKSGIHKGHYDYCPGDCQTRQYVEGLVDAMNDVSAWVKQDVYHRHGLIATRLDAALKDAGR